MWFPIVNWQIISCYAIKTVLGSDQIKTTKNIAVFGKRPWRGFKPNCLLGNFSEYEEYRFILGKTHKFHKYRNKVCQEPFIHIGDFEDIESSHWRHGWQGSSLTIGISCYGILHIFVLNFCLLSGRMEGCYLAAWKILCFF